jgi:hypothetical protein
MMALKFRTLALAALAVSAAFPFAADKAAAEVVYPWCASYTGRDRGVETCGYVSFQQCLATVHGVGGFCRPNPRLAYLPPEPPPRSRRVR